MYYVYLLIDKQGKIYIGYTDNLQRRLAEHLRGKVYWTSRMKDPHLLYAELFMNKESALAR